MTGMGRNALETGHPMKTHHATELTTHFASPVRVSDEKILESSNFVAEVPLFQATINAVPGIILILNHCRQVIGGNQAAFDFFGVGADQLVGKRPGELFGCESVAESPGGCGTAEKCATCGAVNAILLSQEKQCQDTRECRIVQDSQHDDGALDLEVTATAFDTASERFTICFVKDISRTKRLEVLTRMFFHDVLNTSGGIQGFAEMVAAGASNGSGSGEDLTRLTSLTSQLIEEIQAQRDLTYAESGELVVGLEPVDTTTFLQDLQTLYTTHQVAAEREIRISSEWSGSIDTDRRLLARVVGNMLKNALEATEPGGTVEVRCKDLGDRVTFEVWNDAVMPKNVQLQVFQRSFSTKAKAGRGIGTHSMKLLGDTYLGGRVSFSSTAPEGTVFSIDLPKSHADVADEGAPTPGSEPAQTLHGRVLLAEDGPANQRLLGFILRKAGLDVDIAENGRIAYEKALASQFEGNPYQLILMDVQMPEMNGLEATEQLRADGWKGSILALTAHVTKTDQQNCLDAGCNECVTKPIDRPTLLTSVGRYLQPVDAPFASSRSQ